MLGAIIGDICGSPWEGGSCRDGSFQLFANGSGYTDDTVCSIAVTDALLSGSPVSEKLRAWCRRYPGLSYGSMFNLWVYQPSRGPYNSWGNGGAMRSSACGWLAHSIDEAERLAESVSAVTHNHPEGLQGAKALAGTLWLARQGASGRQLQAMARERYGYELGLSVTVRADMEPAGTDAVDTVPIALDCALQASSVADAIHRAAYIGGDTDTTASMAAAIAEARFGLPKHLVEQVLAAIPDEMHPIVRELYAVAGEPMFRESTPIATCAAPKKPWRTRVRSWLRP